MVLHRPDMQWHNVHTIYIDVNLLNLYVWDFAGLLQYNNAYTFLVGFEMPLHQRWFRTQANAE